MTNRSAGIAIFLSLAVGQLTPGNAWATLSSDSYLKEITIADHYVTHQKSIASYAGGSSASDKVRKFVGGDGYRVGDRWEVAASYAQSTQMRMMAPDPAHPVPKSLTGLFRYEVTAVDTAGITVTVTQLQQDGLSIVDPRIEKVQLRFDGRMRQIAKEYVFRKEFKADREPVAVSPDGFRSRMTKLELFALDVPELGSADQGALKSDRLPELPAELNRIAEKTSWRSRVRTAESMEHDDFFGRNVQMLWKTGDPWPAYLQTPMGVSILVRKGGE